MTANDADTTERTDLTPGDVLYDDEHGEAYAVIVDVDRVGVTIRRGDVESFVPHALFDRWNDAGLVAGNPETPERRHPDRRPDPSRA